MVRDLDLPRWKKNRSLHQHMLLRVVVTADGKLAWSYITI